MILSEYTRMHFLGSLLKFVSKINRFMLCESNEQLNDTLWVQLARIKNQRFFRGSAA